MTEPGSANGQATATVHVLLFAGAAELMGQRSIAVNLTGTTRVGELAALVEAQFPPLAALAQRSRWALEDRFLDAQDEVRAGDQLAMIPPVSGG
ncbi:MAG: molybdopterin synthase sulfur carrier subunit [Pirellulaceae bacterium]|nr:MAG: molybdopterin synthase sulfur carrier subunit [Pirellulaceae bacterium]